MNQYACDLIQTKLWHCSLPTGVFTTLLTLLSQAVIPLIYYGMVIGWGVAVTPCRWIMNHVGQNISLYPVTPKEVITRGHKRFWWSTAVLKLLPWRCGDKFSDYLSYVPVWLLSFPWREGQRCPCRMVMVDIKPPCYIYMQQSVKVKRICSQCSSSCGNLPPAYIWVLNWLLALTKRARLREQMCQTVHKNLPLVALPSCRCDEKDIWGSWKVARPPLSGTLVQDVSDSSSKSSMNKVKKMY